MNNIRTASILLWVSCMIGAEARADTPVDLSENRSRDFNARLQRMEDALERLEAEVEIIKSQSTMVIQSTTLSFLDSHYFKAAFALVLPRSDTFIGGTDTGLGFALGTGRYLGRNHVFDLEVGWDIYISAALRYRYEFHSPRTGLTIGPVVGYKARLIKVNPFDRFINSPADLKPSYWLAGVFWGMPMSAGAMLTSEVSYHFNGQELLFVYAGFQFFL